MLVSVRGGSSSCISEHTLPGTLFLQFWGGTETGPGYLQARESAYVLGASNPCVAET